MHSVIELIGGTVKISHASYRDPALHVMEYHVQSSTAVSILGTYMPGNHQPIAAIYRPIEMSQVLFEEGQLDNPLTREAARRGFNAISTARRRLADDQVVVPRVAVNVIEAVNINVVPAAAPIIPIQAADVHVAPAGGGIVPVKVVHGHVAPASGAIVPVEVANGHAAPAGCAIVPVEVANGHVAPGGAIVAIQAADVHVAPRGNAINPIQ
ncbi:hypothetical protein HCN44_005949 [Aphidius gifuensis]|uniref:Uncharacterized protein n=1 Tax=Aphidius gifuensis TaxID=684658 RepID=A0A834Y1B3_APHGI|nr:hypothetical protein HCN44_005949 [Aphidius gifuensis]